MEALLNKFVMEPFTSFVIVTIIVVMLLIFIVWWASGLWHKFKSLPCETHTENIKVLKNESAHKAELPCKEHRDKLDEHSLSIKALEKSIEHLDNLSYKLLSGSSLTQLHSPLSISPKGWEVVKNLGMDKMFNNNWDRIKHLIDEGVTQKTPYDINEFCIKYAVVYPEKFLQQKDIDIIKNDAYKQGLILTDYMKVIAVMARERYFIENHINIEETKTE